MPSSAGLVATASSLIVVAACSTAAPQAPPAQLPQSAGADSDIPEEHAALATGAPDAGVPSAPAPMPKSVGTFPPKWIDGTACAAEAPVQTWSYDESTMLLRQSLCTNFEGPFMVLLVGSTRAMLIDTGTGDANVRSVVDAALAGKNVDLVVAHSHAHSDHVGGDSLFAGRARTTVIGHSPSAVTSAFGIDAASAIGAIDLGGRVVDVLAIPGHEASHVAFYDRETRLLLTGDTLYPGRLYVRDWGAYRASVARLVAFVDAGNPISHVVGAHIELSAADVEYPAGATKHPGEHSLALGENHLRDLLATVNAMADAPLRTKRPSYVVVPLR